MKGLDSLMNTEAVIVINAIWMAVAKTYQVPLAFTGWYINFEALTEYNGFLTEC